MTEERSFERLEAVVIVVACVFVVLGTLGKPAGNAADSRLATVVALADRGTWYIDRPPEEKPIPFERRMIDKVAVRGRLMSSKPPVLSLLMTGEYVVLRGLFGWSLGEEAGREKVVRFMSLTLVGLAYVLMLFFAMRLMRLFVEDPIARLICLISLAFCTQLWGYATSINNHVPAACLVAVALYLGLGMAGGKVAPSRWRFIVFGLAAGLVAVVDMPAGVFSLASGLLLFSKWPRKTMLWAIPGVAIPVAVHTAIMVSVTGSPMPVQMDRGLYLFESSYWRNPRGIDALNEPKAVYLFHATLGRRGLFSLYPVVLIGVVSAFVALVRRESVYRTAILAGAVAFVIQVLYYVLWTDNYGGESFGFRWFITAMPVLILMGAPLLSRLNRGGAWLLVGALMGVSFYSAWQCTVDPWVANAEWTCRFLGTSY